MVFLLINILKKSKRKKKKIGALFNIVKKSNILQLQVKYFFEKIYVNSGVQIYIYIYILPNFSVLNYQKYSSSPFRFRYGMVASPTHSASLHLIPCLGVWSLCTAIKGNITLPGINPSICYPLGVRWHRLSSNWGQTTTKHCIWLAVVGGRT